MQSGTKLRTSCKLFMSYLRTCIRALLLTPFNKAGSSGRSRFRQLPFSNRRGGRSFHPGVTLRSNWLASSVSVEVINISPRVGGGSAKSAISVFCGLALTDTVLALFLASASTGANNQSISLLFQDLLQRIIILQSWLQFRERWKYPTTICMFVFY